MKLIAKYMPSYEAVKMLNPECNLALWPDASAFDGPIANDGPPWLLDLLEHNHLRPHNFGGTDYVQWQINLNTANGLEDNNNLYWREIPPDHWIFRECDLDDGYVTYKLISEAAVLSSYDQVVVLSTGKLEGHARVNIFKALDKLMQSSAPEIDK